jgi:hypothetical protein
MGRHLDARTHGPLSSGRTHVRRPLLRNSVPASPGCTLIVRSSGGFVILPLGKSPTATAPPGSRPRWLRISGTVGGLKTVTPAVQGHPIPVPENRRRQTCGGWAAIVGTACAGTCNQASNNGTDRDGAGPRLCQRKGCHNCRRDCKSSQRVFHSTVPPCP